MKHFAVSYINYFDNDLKLKIVPAKIWKGALESAFPGMAEFLPDDKKQAKIEAANQENH